MFVFYIIFCKHILYELITYIYRQLNTIYLMKCIQQFVLLLCLNTQIDKTFEIFYVVFKKTKSENTKKKYCIRCFNDKINIKTV
jgi:hypothetical protein